MWVVQCRCEEDCGSRPGFWEGRLIGVGNHIGQWCVAVAIVAAVAAIVAVVVIISVGEDDTEAEILQMRLAFQFCEWIRFDFQNDC